jgi:outer membrane murein-binding lipoprotein Lpp
MPEARRIFLLFLASFFVFALAAHGQDDSPPLGDVARQSRLQKQQKDAQAKDAQSKDTPTKDPQTKDAQNKDTQGVNAQGKANGAVANDAQPPKVPHVITNEEIPEHIGPARSSAAGSQTPATSQQQPPAYGDGKAPAEYWKSQIQAQKNAIASLKSEIESLSASIQYAGANCVSGCVQWNERQKQKQDQVESMKLQLEEQQKRLEEMQEAARQQGYGSSVYDP